LALCEDIKAYLIGYVRKGDTYTVNGAAEMIKEITAQLTDGGLEITFRMDSGYFDDAILETIESLMSQPVVFIYPTKKIISDARICESESRKILHNGGNDAKLKIRW
jgi:transposase